MNYLTNYYKNLCEQLENKVNFLKMQLNEEDYSFDGKSETPTQTNTNIGQSFGNFANSKNNLNSDQFGGAQNKSPSWLHKEGDTWTGSDGIKYRIRNGQMEFYWVGKNGEGWLPVDDRQVTG